MNLFNPPELRSERLVLTPIRVGDEAAVMDLFVDDSYVTQFVGWKPLINQQMAQGFTEREALAWQDEEDCRGWLARDSQTDEVLGSIVARRRDQSAEFSYVVKRVWWNQGYATEIARTFLERARQDSSLRQVSAVCDVENVASHRVLEKAGMKFDKTLPSHQKHNIAAEPRDCVRFTILVGEGGTT